MRRISLSDDAKVSRQLQQWPNRPPGLSPDHGPDAWLRGRPGSASCASHPFLKYPGSDRMRTLPDGLWLNFGGTAEEPFVDIFAIEACGTLTNLLDKRSRFAATTHSLLAVCPIAWLLAAAGPDEAMPRWRATGVIAAEPSRALVAPVRDMRVMYGLKPRQFAGFVATQVPHAHEFFVPMAALTTEHSLENPDFRALIGRAAATANFLMRFEGGLERDWVR